MSRPLLGLTACFGLGAWLGQALPARAAEALLAMALALLLVAWGRRVAWACLALAGAALATGAGSAALETVCYERTELRLWLAGADPDTAVQLEGRLPQDPWPQQERWVLLLDVGRLQGRASRGRARISVGGAGRRPELMAGDRVRLWARLRAPRDFGNPGSPDSVARARREGVHALGYCKSPLLVQRLPADGFTLTRAAAQVRAWARRRIAAQLPAGPEEALVRAMLLGDRSGLGDETEESFRIAGTYHVLALSGAQVALVAGGLLWGLRRLQASPAATALLVCGGLGFYALLVGGQVPIVRAVVMAAALLLGHGLELDTDLANLLGFAALLLLVERPSTVADVSFQLSFGATLAILLLTPAVLRLLPALPLRLDLGLAASLAAQLALSPLLAAHFHRLAPAAVLLNLLAVPLSGGVLVAGAALVAVAPVSAPLAGLAGGVAFALAHALLGSADVVRLLPWLDLRVPAPQPAAYATFALGLYLLALPSRVRLGAWVLAGGVALVLFPVAAPPDGRLSVTVLDVGQGDALVVRTPGGQVWLVDAGPGGPGRFDLGEAVVAPFLWSEGLRRVDGLVLTHPHPDHVGGAAAVLRAFDVGAVWEGIAPRHDGGGPALARALEERPRLWLCVTRGYRTRWDAVDVRVLGPQRPGRPPWRTRNDDSVVLALGYGDVVLLLAGDVEHDAEARLQPPRADVLKVPHHGSRTSSSPALLSATLPRVAIISAGFRNSFGHPHPEVVARYAQLGCRVFRTDLDGAVTVSTDGRSIRVTSFSGESHLIEAPPRGL